jgi:hypothetical protein
VTGFFIQDKLKRKIEVTLDYMCWMYHFRAEDVCASGAKVNNERKK